MWYDEDPDCLLSVRALFLGFFCGAEVLAKDHFTTMSSEPFDTIMCHDLCTTVIWRLTLCAMTVISTRITSLLQALCAARLEALLAMARSQMGFGYLVALCFITIQ